MLIKLYYIGREELLKRIVSGIMLVLLLISTLALAFNIQPVKASETIYIRADGSIEPSTAPISSLDNITYTFTGNIYDSIVVERNNIVIDGSSQTLQGSGNGTGIYMSHLNNVTVKNTQIRSFQCGIWLEYSSYCSISENSVTSNVQGIVLDTVSYSKILGNNITHNKYGIYLYQFSENYIHHNNLVNNAIQVHYHVSENFWDDGYPSGGNYWSDYIGPDVYGGRFQNEIGSDGIGDTQYVIIENITDHYPLMKPYAGPHDIGTASFNTSKTIVGQGYSINISVKIINYGKQTETFNVTARANAMEIQTQTGTLMTRNFTILAFTWNTTGFAEGSYTISVKVDTVPGETDTADNTCSAGTVTVTIPGDVDGDFDVDIYDVVKITSRYWEILPPIWPIPPIDLDDDGVITIYDAVICTSHYGQSEIVYEPMQLIDYMKEIADVIDWTFTGNDTVDYRLIYAGLMFGKNTTTDLENLIDSYGSNASTWKECLFLSAWAQKFGIERQTAIENALNNSQMTSGGLPVTDSDGYFYVTKKYALMGYYWAIQYNYLLNKWNLTEAYDTYIAALNNSFAYDSLPMRIKFEYDYGINSRYYDEGSSNIQCLLMFYAFNETDALDWAAEIWNFINSNNWDTSYLYYRYTPSSAIYECETGFFLQDIALYKHRYFSMSNWSYVIQDCETRFLQNNWTGKQWLDGHTGKTTYVLVHAYPSNTQRRLQNTFGAWLSMLGVSQLLNQTQKTIMANMLQGFNGYSPAWKLLMNASAQLYDYNTNLFRMESSSTYGYIPTSYALALMFYMGIVPQTGMVAIPLEDYGYEYVQVGFDQDLFKMDFSTHSIKLAVYNGSFTFQFGSTPFNYTLSQIGVYNITFASDWNSINSATYLNSLPTNRKFLREIVEETSVFSEGVMALSQVGYGDFERSSNLPEVIQLSTTVFLGKELFSHPLRIIPTISRVIFGRRIHSNYRK